MRKTQRFLLSVAVVLAVSLFAVPAAFASDVSLDVSGASDSNGSELDYAPDEVVIMFHLNVTRAQAEDLLAREGLTWRSESWYEEGSPFPVKVVVAGLPEGANLEETIARLRQSELVASAGLNGIAQPGVLYPAEFARLWGVSALDTMKAVTSSPRGFSQTGGTVVVVSASGYWDALSASALAGLVDAPVLMTAADSLSSQTADELARLNPSRVIVVGGELSVSSAVFDRIAAKFPAVVRVAGTTAAQTAEKVAENALALNGSWSDTAFVATSASYHDALSIASYAYAKRSPLFFTDADGALSDTTLAAIRAHGFSHVYILGGNMSVPASVETQLGTLFAGRLSGQNGVDTSAAIAAWGLAHGMNRICVGVASAEAWQDALCGAAVCGKHSSVLLLASDGNLQAIDRVVPRGYTQCSCMGYIFGGNLSVSDKVQSYLDNLKNQSSYDPWDPGDTPGNPMPATLEKGGREAV